MANSLKLADKILKKVRRYEAGSRVFSAKDFAGLGTTSGIYKALSRLVAEQKLRRVGRGLYDRPASSALINGPVPASIDAVLDAVRRKTNAVIVPEHAAAANALGLTTALPVRPAFVASKAISDIRVGTRTIRFRTAESVLEPWLTSDAAPIVQSLLWLKAEGFALDEAAPTIRKRATAKAKKALDRNLKRLRLPAWMLPVAHEIVRHGAPN